MTSETSTPRSGRRRLLLAVGIVGLALWAAALVAVGGRIGTESDTASESTPVAETTVAPLPVAFQAPARRVVLPAGGEQVDEYPTRFPRSAEGAAAAAVALTRYSASLDYAVVAEVLRLYAVPGERAARSADAAAAAAVSAGRARLGLPMAGPAPMDASVFAEPFAVRWTAKGAEEFVVSVLSAVDYRSGQTTSREVVAAATRWRWDAAAGDWRVLPVAVATTAPVAEIGSAEFNDAGWIALAERRP